MNRFARPSARQCTRLLPLVCGCFLLGSCASVTVRKVPTPTQYEHWTDDMQKQADSIHGIRFYLPRPFVNVFESFPVRTDVNFASGEVSPDGKYVVIKKIYGTPGSFIPADVQVSTKSLTYPTPGASAQSDAQSKSNSTGGTTPTAESSTGNLLQQPSAPTTPSTPLSPSTPSPKTGQNQQSSTNNNFAFAYQPLRGNFDLVYMPDFDEQYAVDSFAGLGNANFEVNLGQGWSLQGYNSLSDNSEINKRIFDLMDTSIQLAKSAASAELGQVFPLLNQAAKAVSAPGVSMAAPQSDSTAKNAVPAGTPVSMKIIVLHYAAKGLYPVIKPRELQERVAKADIVYDVWDLFKLFPHPEYSTGYNTAELQNAQKAIEPESANSTIPRYPYQYLSFNTFRYVAVEVIQPDSPFATKYSATGTDDDPGAARTADPIELLKQLKSLFGPSSDSGGGNQTNTNQNNEQSKGPTDQQVQAMNEALQKVRVPPSGDKFYSLENPDWKKAPGTLIADLKINRGHPDGTTEAQAFKSLQTQASNVAGASKFAVTKLQLANRPANLDALQKLYDVLKDSTKVGYPKPETGTPPAYAISDAWLDTTPGANASAPLQGTLTFQITPALDPMKGITPANLQDSFVTQANSQIDLIPDLKGKVTVAHAIYNDGK